MRDLQNTKLFYVYEFSDNTACFYTNELVCEGDIVRYKDEFTGEVVKVLTEEAEKKYKNWGKYWQQINII